MEFHDFFLCENGNFPQFFLFFYLFGEYIDPFSFGFQRILAYSSIFFYYLAISNEFP